LAAPAVESTAPGVYAVEQALQPVVEDRVEVEVVRFAHDVAKPGVTGGVRPLPQAAVVADLWGIALAVKIADGAADRAG
jgi:hypothetical protein